MSGNRMAQMTEAERKPNIRLQVDFQILSPASNWIQDWSNQLVIGVDNKTTYSLGKHEISEGWWSHYLKSISFQFSTNNKQYQEEG